MQRTVGTIARGIRLPIVRQGAPLDELVVQSVLQAAGAEAFPIRDHDIVGITESIVARVQGNNATVDTIAKDLRTKFGGDTLGVVFPILSRNRYAILLKGIARSTRHVVLLLSYPADEVGNLLLDPDLLDETGINPWSDTLTEVQFQQHFGGYRHPFTGVDYIAYYRSLVEAEGATCTFLFSNQPQAILPHAAEVLACDIHTRFRTKKILRQAGVAIVHSLDEILAASIDGSGFHPEYGLLGSNKATEEIVKLFPRDCQALVDRIQQLFREKTGKIVEVLIYGDGAFKDPAGKIWELADPVVSPAFTAGLAGTPNEIKLKYLADNQYANLSGDALQAAIARQIQHKAGNARDSAAALGTTPRRLTDLIGSLCDLISGSGDKGTPVVYIQGYFDNYASD